MLTKSLGGPSPCYQVGVQSNSTTFLACSKISTDRAPVVPWQSGTADLSVRQSIRRDISCWCSIGLWTEEAGYLSLSIVLPAPFKSSLCCTVLPGEAVTFCRELLLWRTRCLVCSGGWCVSKWHAHECKVSQQNTAFQHHSYSPKLLGFVMTKQCF